MRSSYRRKLALTVPLLLSTPLMQFLAAPASAAATLPSGWSAGSADVTYQGSSVLATAGLPSANSPDDLPPPSEHEMTPFLRGVRNGAQDHLPSPTTETPVNVSPSGFDGMTALDQRLADGNHDANIQVPDQSLCVGNGYVLQGVNSTLRVFSTDGTPLTDTISQAPFFGDGHEVMTRRPAFVLGALHSDPRCLFDTASGRFILTVMRFHRDSANGFRYENDSVVEIAVSRTGDPRGEWDLYAMDTAADGTQGSPAIPGCPCLGDLPLIGEDAHGIYITTDEWSYASMNSGSEEYEGERFHAISRRELLDGSVTSATTLTLVGSPQQGPFPVHTNPASVPPGGAQDESNGGTEYLISACETAPDHVFLFALTNTSSLDSNDPSLSLSEQYLPVGATSYSGSFAQPDGPRPLASWIQQQTGGALPPVEYLDPGLPCSQVTYADGRLWTARAVAMKPANGPVKMGIVWYQIVPTVTDGQVNGRLVNQGDVDVNRANTITPAITVDRTGHGVLGFALYGDSYNPSLAYVPIDESGTGPATIVGQGAVPLDSEGGYAYFGSRDRITRFGDYTAAITTGDGDFWIAGEYTPNVPRTLATTWGSRIAQIH